MKDREAKEVRRGGAKFKKTITAQKKTPPHEALPLDQILCGDSELLLKEIPSSCVDIIITSPPYNFGLEYEDDHREDAVRWEEYFKKINRIWVECARILKPGGRLCVNVQPMFSDYVPTHHVISNQLLNLGLLWKGEILWEKNNYNCKYTAWGSWKQPSMPYLKYTWEFVEVFCKESHRKPGDSSKADISADEFKAWVYAKWSIAPERRMKEYGHPAMFPEALVERLLKLFSYRDDIVLDPFNGVGTTTVVASKNKRYFIGMDVSPQYCKIAEERIKNISPELPLDVASEVK